jgi:hypothetical protein
MSVVHCIHQGQVLSPLNTKEIPGSDFRCVKFRLPAIF